MSKTDPASLQAELQGLLEAKLRSKTIDLPIPGFGGRLWATFRKVDYKGQKQIAKRNTALDETEAEVNASADTLIRACVTVFARMPDGSKQDLGVTLGRSLAEYLGQGVEGLTDRQALFLLFTNDEGELEDLQIVGLAGDFGRFVAGAVVVAEDEAASDFEGAGS